MTRARDELILSPRRRLRRRPAPGACRRSSSRRSTCRRRRSCPVRARPRRAPLERIAAAAAAVPPERGAGARPVDEPLTAQLRGDRRLPDLPAEVQVRPRPPGPDRAAPRDGLRRGAPQGGPGVPPPPRARRRDDRGGARRRVRGGLDERGLPDPGARGGAPRRRPRRAPPVPGGRSSSPGAVIPAYVEREFTLQPRRRPDPRPLGPGRHRAGRRRAGAGARPPDAPPRRTPTPSRRRSS